MRPKKQSKAWNIAATHWLTAGFAIPFVVSFVAGILLVAIGIESNGITTNIAGLVLAPIGIWLGVMYSARYLAKKYIVTDGKKIAKIATIYNVVLSLMVGVLLGWFRYTQAIRANELLNAELVSPAQVLTGELVYWGIYAVLSSIALYFASRKYVQTDNTATPGPMDAGEGPAAPASVPL